MGRRRKRRRLLLTVLDAVYVDVHDGNATVTIQPKAAFEEVPDSLTPAPAFTL